MVVLGDEEQPQRHMKSVDRVLIESVKSVVLVNNLCEIMTLYAMFLYIGYNWFKNLTFSFNFKNTPNQFL